MLLGPRAGTRQPISSNTGICRLIDRDEARQPVIKGDFKGPRRRERLFPANDDRTTTLHGPGQLRKWRRARDGHAIQGNPGTVHI